MGQQISKGYSKHQRALRAPYSLEAFLPNPLDPAGCGMNLGNLQPLGFGIGF